MTCLHHISLSLLPIYTFQFVAFDVYLTGGSLMVVLSSLFFNDFCTMHKHFNCNLKTHSSEGLAAFTLSTLRSL